MGLANHVYGSRVLKIQDSGTDVQEFQIKIVAFAATGFPVPCDGTFDEATEKALKNFCKLFGLPQQATAEAAVFQAIETWVKDEVDFLEVFKAQYPCTCSSVSAAQKTRIKEIWDLRVKGKAHTQAGGVIADATCTGFGNELAEAFKFDKASISSGKLTAFDEKPGFNKILLWALLGARKILKTELKTNSLKMGINNGYRCQLKYFDILLQKVDAEKLDKEPVALGNHTGNAVDLRIGACTPSKARDLLKAKYAFFEDQASTKNHLRLEPRAISPRWTHLDVTTFEYRSFVKTVDDALEPRYSGGSATIPVLAQQEQPVVSGSSSPKPEIVSPSLNPPRGETLKAAIDTTIQIRTDWVKPPPSGSIESADDDTPVAQEFAEDECVSEATLPTEPPVPSSPTEAESVSKDVTEPAKAPEPIKVDPVAIAAPQIPMDSGLFPVGLNLTWHGGIHVTGATGQPVVAMADGVVVAARLPDKDPEATPFGSRNFVLIKHRTPAGDDFWSVYMHLLPVQLKDDDPDMVKAMPWLYELELATQGDGSTNFRPHPDTVSTFAVPRTVEGGEKFAILDQRQVGKYLWYQVESKKDQARGWIAKTERVTISRKIRNLPDLKAGKVVKFSQPIKGAACIGFMSSIKPDAKAFLHWEVFSEKLIPGWGEVRDDDQNDVGCDSEALKKLINKGAGGGAYQGELTKEMVAASYKDKETLVQILSNAYRFKSEWFVNWEEALKRYDPASAQAQGPLFNLYRFWEDAEKAGCDLPKGGMVYHYHPNAFKLAMFPEPKAHRAEVSVVPEGDVSFYLLRDSKKVDVVSPKDLEEEDFSHYVTVGGKKKKTKNAVVYSKHDDKILGTVCKYGAYKGISYSAGINLYQMLVKDGGPNAPAGMTDRAKRIWASLYHSEGSLDGINSYDNAFLSMGAIQQTCGTGTGGGELPAALNAVKLADAALYKKLLGDFKIEPVDIGKGLPGNQSGYLSVAGKSQKTIEEKESLRKFFLAYRIRDALRDTRFADAFYSYGFKRLDLVDDATQTEGTKTYRFKDIYKTELAAALVLDAHINRPVLGRSVWWDAAKKTCPLADLENGKVTLEQEKKMIKEILALRNASKMTDPKGRAAYILLCLKDLDDTLAKSLGFADEDAIRLSMGTSPPPKDKLSNYKLGFLGVER